MKYSKADWLKQAAQSLQSKNMQITLHLGLYEFVILSFCCELIEGGIYDLNLSELRCGGKLQH